MTSTIALIHIAKNDLGLDDETYRDLLERETGKRSSKAMTEAERQTVLAVFRRNGWKPRLKGSRKRLDRPYAAKLQALWIAGWNLGVVRDRRDSAMLAFIKRQTGIEHTRFLRDGDDALKAIEALKDWLHREAGVDWSTDGGRGKGLDADPRLRVLHAQWQRLIDIGAVEKFGRSGTVGLWDYGYAVVTKSHPQFYEDQDWIAMQNALGRKLRAALARRKAA